MNTIAWQAIAVVLLVCSLGYVFLFRPYQTRTHCLAQATAEYASVPGENDREVKIDVANQECLLRNGLY